MGTFRHSQDSL